MPVKHIISTMELKHSTCFGIGVVRVHQGTASTMCMKLASITAFLTTIHT